MDSAKHLNKSRLARTFAKVLHIQAVTGAAKGDKFQKTKAREKVNHDKPVGESRQPVFSNEEEEKLRERAPVFSNEEEEKLRERAVLDAFLAKLFATISSVKATYAQMQHCEFPYDEEEILEQKNLIKTYEISANKLDSKNKLKDSEIIFLKEKLEELRRENKSIEKRLNSSGSLSSMSSHENLSLDSLSATNFISYVKQATRSIRSLVKFMISEMESANWDLDAAADSIHPDIVYWDTTHICYAFESFVCREMFDGFNHPEFRDSGSKSMVRNEKRRQFFDKFMELKSLKAREYIAWKPTSMFAEFCRAKYLKLVHPKLESSLFENLNQRNLVNARKFPETAFFDLFLDVAKRVWLLHCLAFSFGPEEATVFQVAKGSRFSEVFMESVNEEAFLSHGCTPEVGFMVVPGFMVGKTVIQCKVYLV
nr:protein gravitropic in the light 1-like isoform X2 [Tanacetum cinerariifolium]